MFEPLPAYRQRPGTNPELLLDNPGRGIRTVCATVAPRPLQRLGMLFDDVSQPQPREREKRPVDWVVASVATTGATMIAVDTAATASGRIENNRHQRALAIGEQRQRFFFPVLAGHNRPPTSQSWHDSGMGKAPGRRSSNRFERIALGKPWCEALRLEDGRKLIARPILPGDAETLRRSFGDLTPEEIRFRFLHPITELTPEYAHRLTHIDRHRAFALVIVEALPPEKARIGAVARAIVDNTDEHAEFAIIVGREIGRFGLGTYLLNRITEWSRKKGMRSIYGDVMVENQRMLRLAKRLGFEAGLHPTEPQLVRIWRPLRAGL